MRSSRPIRLTRHRALCLLRKPTGVRRRASSGPRVPHAVWQQLDVLREQMAVSKPWTRVPGLHLHLSGQLRSGKNAEGIRITTSHVLTVEMKVVELPKVVRHARDLFERWRDGCFKEVSEQIGPWRRELPFRLPLRLSVWYWPSDRRIRDRSGMSDALFHMLERGGVVANDGLIEDLVWHTMPLAPRQGRAILVLTPLVPPDVSVEIEKALAC